jgi:hypothetical protein
MYVRKYVCIYVRMYVYIMHVCMHAWVDLFILICGLLNDDNSSSDYIALSLTGIPKVEI